MVCVRGQASMTSLPVASAKLLPIWTARAPQILHGECMGDPSKASSHVTIPDWWRQQCQLDGSDLACADGATSDAIPA